MENNISWTRGELKKRSKEVMRVHYWRVILITFLLSVFIGSGTVVTEFAQSFAEGFEEGYEEAAGEAVSHEEDSDKEEVRRKKQAAEQKMAIVYVTVAIIMIVVIVIVVFAVAFLVSFFVINPLYVGGMRFYIRSFETKPQYKEMFFGFENHYKNVVSVMALRDIYTILWSLLFVIPGIVKSYEYAMVPYLLAENAEMPAKEAFAASRQMMKGQKWKAFVLDMSFLGWQLLSILTIGILGIFYVEPYMQLTGAALYRRLKGADRIPENIYYDGMDKETAHGWYKHGLYQSSEEEK